MTTIAETIAASPLEGYTISSTNAFDAKLAQQYPVQPQGYRLLVALPPKDDKVGLIHKPQDRRDIDHRFVRCVKVLAMGDLAYQDKDKFPTGPWCKVGDWIQIGALEGDPFLMKGFEKQEFRLINDDMVQSVLTGPDAVERV